jgi:hypothetical protein
MRFSSFRALGVLVAGAAIAGCGGSQIGIPGGAAMAPPLGERYASPAHAGNLNGETLSAKRVSAGCAKSYSSFYFMATGEATGPYPGTFKASGLVTVGSGSQSSAFTEDFVIDSGSQTISGRAAASGSKISLNCVYVTLLVSHATYKDHGSRGRTQLQYGYPKKFTQSFQ